MATLQSDEANILDAETINWRLVVYPLLAVLVVVVGGFGYYYYLQNQREDLETKAHLALVKARTPEEMVKIADQFPHADQAIVALLAGASGSFAQRDYAAATQDYQRVISTVTTDPELRDTAQLGLGSVLEATGKADDAIKAYLAVAERGAASPYAPYAYDAVARIYDSRGDKDNERKILTQAAGLDPDSFFVKQAQLKLRELMPSVTMPAPDAAVPPTPTPAASAPTSNVVTPPVSAAAPSAPASATTPVPAAAPSAPASATAPASAAAPVTNQK